MMHTRVRARLVVLAAALPFVFALSPRATAQTPELEAFYKKLEPKGEFKYKWKGKEATTTAGVFRWEVPTPEEGGTFGTGGLDRNFSGLCAEVLVPITADKIYRFKIGGLYDPSNFGGAGKDNKEVTEKEVLGAQRRVTYIKELFGRYYTKPFDQVYTGDELIAMQIALWEVIQETEPPEGDAKPDVFGGDFQAGYDRANAPAYVTKAQEFLDTLTGTDAPFYENPDLRGRELIRLQGIENADGVVAQSQFALRYAGGGGVGAGSLNRALTASAGAGAAGGGAPLGGFGTGGGNGGGLAAGNGGGSPGFASSTPTPSPVNTSLLPPPPSVTTSVPPVGGPDEPTKPVPAPAGVLLGFIALGTLGSWRLGVRLLARK